MPYPWGSVQVQSDETGVFPVPTDHLWILSVVNLSLAMISVSPNHVFYFILISYPVSHFPSLPLFLLIQEQTSEILKPMLTPSNFGDSVVTGYWLDSVPQFTS